MFALAVVLILITCIVLILIVLVQNPKGGGLSATFGGANQFGGVAQTKSLLDKLTWGLAIALLVFSLLASISINREKVEEQSDIYEYIQNYDYTTPPDIPTDIQLPEQ